MKLLVKIFWITMLCAILVQAFPKVGEKVLPNHDFQMYCYQTKQEWKLSDHLDGNTVVLLITGSIC